MPFLTQKLRRAARAVGPRLGRGAVGSLMHYDVVIIGAGMSGLAAGIRLAHFDRSVCIVEKHYAFGGLNSYYTLDGRSFDVGLHAVTNFALPGDRHAPLAKLLRQLRLTREDFDLQPQRYSEVRFPGRRLRFTNDIAVLREEVAREFPREADAFGRLIEDVRGFDDVRLDQPYQSARSRLGSVLRDPVLIDMLLCPIMYYGSAQEHDMDFAQFVTMFKALFLEGFARPPDGVRRIIRKLVKKYRRCGGTIRMRSGVDRIRVDGGRVSGLTLTSGETLTADTVLSSAGYVETMRLCEDSRGRASEDSADAIACDRSRRLKPAAREGTSVHLHGVSEIGRDESRRLKPAAQDGPGSSTDSDVGRMSFVETIGVLDRMPHELGHDATIVFFNDADRFRYARPDQPVDLTSGVVCCPSNYEGHESMREGLFRVTWMADPRSWLAFDERDYAEAKAACYERFIECGERCIPGFRDHVVAHDMFTPRTIQRFTGHLNGAVYGSPHKQRDGRTPVENLFICGTDQGFVGIIGAMLSGITMANVHVLERMSNVE